MATRVMVASLAKEIIAAAAGKEETADNNEGDERSSVNVPGNNYDQAVRVAITLIQSVSCSGSPEKSRQ